MNVFRTIRRLARPLLVAAVALGGIMATAPYGRATPLDDAPDGVLGQPDFTTGTCVIVSPSASTVCGPRDVATDSSGNVFVLDNNRVLEYDNPFLTGNAVADRVFGQPSMTSVGCDASAISASSLCGPAGLFVDAADNLWVSDSRNHRVLAYESPLVDQIADHVIGQPTFSTGYYSNSADAVLWFPQGLVVDASFNLWVVETYRNRVVEFDDITLDTMTPDHVYGQPDFEDVSCDSGGATGLCSPVDVALDGDGSLYVSDGVNRVLVYETPLVDQTADHVIGQPNFTSYACNAPTAATLCTPRGIAVDADASSLYVSDAGHNRVLRFDGGAPYNPVADAVYGQLGSFTGSQSCSPLGAGNMCEPWGLDIDVNGNLWVGQFESGVGTSRVLVFGATCATFTDGDCDAFKDVAPTLHAGPANANTAVDNCIGVGNPTQANFDGNFTNLHPAKSYDDLTWPNSDAAGDLCDTDADNDGLTDASETSGTACGEVSAPLERDTDGDRYLDGAECALMFLPNDAGDHPTLVNCGGGPSSWNTDADGDGVIRAREICFYNTNPNVANTDGDICNDGKEVASINGDNNVNAVDLSQVAQHFITAYTLPAPPHLINFDITKDGNINATDLSQIAQRFGPC